MTRIRCHTRCGDYFNWSHFLSYDIVGLFWQSKTRNIDQILHDRLLTATYSSWSHEGRQASMEALPLHLAANHKGDSLSRWVGHGNCREECNQRNYGIHSMNTRKSGKTRVFGTYIHIQFLLGIWNGALISPSQKPQISSQWGRVPSHNLLVDRVTPKIFALDYVLKRTLES